MSNPSSQADPKPHLAILGAGPIGLDAALAAAERGWSFTLFEAADVVAGNIDSWGHVRLFTPWAMDVSDRMRRALDSAGRNVPDSADECPTGRQLIDEVLAPVAALDAVRPHLRLETRVRAIGRSGLLKHEEIANDERGGRPFRLLVADAAGERVEYANAVVDCSGSYEVPNWLGDGGIPAPGELNPQVEPRLARRLPDFGEDRSGWLGKTILLVGAGHSAQTAARDLAEITKDHPETRVIWALRRLTSSWRMDDDALPERSNLASEAEAIAAGDAARSASFEVRRGVVVEAIEPVSNPSGRPALGETDAERLRVALRSDIGEIEWVEVDRIVSLVGSVGDASIYRQLQVHECYATSGPMKLAAALLGSSSSDCLAQESAGADALVNPEPGFFILGSKSYGRTTTFLLRTGFEQVDEAFGLLAERMAPISAQRRVNAS